MTRQPSARRPSVRRWARHGTATWICALLVAIAAPPADAAQANRATGPAQQALAALEQRQFARARQAIGRTADPFARAALLFALYRRDGNPASGAEILGFIAAHPDWPLQAALRRQAEQAPPGALPDGRMLAWFARHPPTTQPGCIRHIGLLRQRGDREAARREIARCWLGLAMTTAGEKTFFRRYGRAISHADRAARVRAHLDRGRRRSAHRLLTFFKLSPGYAIPLRLRVDLQRRPQPGGVRHMLRRVGKLPASARAAAGLRLDLARWNRRRGQLEAAAAGLVAAALPQGNREENRVGEPLEPPPGPLARRWRRERSIAVRELLDERRPARAYTVAAAHFQGSGYRFADAERLAGWIALRKTGQAATALQHFRRIRAGVQRRDLRAMAAWWAGEALRAAGQPDAAKARYRQAAAMTFDLHGQLAQMRLGARSRSLPADTAIPAPARAAFDGETAVRLARFFHRHGAARDSRQLLWYLLRRSLRPPTGGPEDDRLTGARLLPIAELAAELGERHIAVRAARFALARGFVRTGLAYPAIALPQRLPVEPALLLAVIRQETEFNAKARSHAGARGLMQLLPATARFAARRAGLKWSRRRLGRDPVYNIRLGAAYLHYLLCRFDGSYLLAAAAYNAGPTRVARWTERYGDPQQGPVDRPVDWPVDWIESIPYGETRNFVRRVLANVAVYRLLLGDDRVAATPAHAWRARGAGVACPAKASGKQR